MLFAHAKLFLTSYLKISVLHVTHCRLTLADQNTNSTYSNTFYVEHISHKIDHLLNYL